MIRDVSTSASSHQMMISDEISQYIGKNSHVTIAMLIGQPVYEKHFAYIAQSNKPMMQRCLRSLTTA